MTYRITPRKGKREKRRYNLFLSVRLKAPLNRLYAVLTSAPFYEAFYDDGCLRRRVSFTSAVETGELCRRALFTSLVVIRVCGNDKRVSSTNHGYVIAAVVIHVGGCDW